MAKIAVIGSGISGLASAWILSQEHEVTIYEKNDYIGGHTNTRTATFGNTTVKADTGFMVFNHQTYPNMLRLFEYLDIETVPTDMSFGVSSNHGKFEFSSDSVFLGFTSYINPAHWRMVLDIVSFNKTVENAAEKLPELATVSDLLKDMKLGKRFIEKYLLPMSGAIWSTDKNKILEFPAKKFVSFLNNHGLLSPKTLNPRKIKAGRLQWYTVVNGANTYVRKILARTSAVIKKDCTVVKVTRSDNSVTIQEKNGTEETYDHVVFASHPDQTLSLLGEPSSSEQMTLGAFTYSQNEMYMHKNTSFLMKKTPNWPSWSYTECPDGNVEISYYMNRLQSIDKKYPVIVTLNPSRPLDDEEVFYRTTYEHPLFTTGTEAAQREIGLLQGKQNTWFAGAWLGHGFHEDGLRSAIEIGKAFNLTPPWEQAA